MSDPFTSYAAQATSQRPAPLLGPIKTRHALRERYAEIVTMLGACSDAPALEAVIDELKGEITQIHAEHDFFWSGDGDFLGLEREIERARARVDDGLDFPRWDVR